MKSDRYAGSIAKPQGFTAASIRRSVASRSEPLGHLTTSATPLLEIGVAAIEAALEHLLGSGGVEEDVGALLGDAKVAPQGTVGVGSCDAPGVSFAKSWMASALSSEPTPTTARSGPYSLASPRLEVSGVRQVGHQGAQNQNTGRLAR